MNKSERTNRKPKVERNWEVQTLPNGKSLLSFWVSRATK